MDTKKIKIKRVRTDYSGKVFGPWKILSYIHHYGTSPIWECECLYCKKIWQTSLPKIKKKRECECEESLKFTSGVYIINNIYREYAKKARKEDESFRLSYIDLYKIYNRQNGKDTDGNDLIFKYHWDYTNTPATCDYIWPDLERKTKSNSYNLDNCFFVMNEKQRFPRKRGNQIKKALRKKKS